MTSSELTAALERRAEAVGSFFGAQAHALAAVCHRMAERFARGGRIVAFGVGAAATDAQHISVEFVHPVIVGKRALPALALVNDGPTSLGLSAADPTTVFERQVHLHGGPDDIAIGLTHRSSDPGADAVARGLKQAGAVGMQTIAFTGPDPIAGVDADATFSVASEDPFIVQEVQETAYHVLWESVHVFFEHKGLLSGRHEGRRHDVGASRFLYPFLAEEETGLDVVLAQVSASILEKAGEVTDIRAATAALSPLFDDASGAARARLDAGGKVIAFGNGGSATDAQDLVTDLVTPPPGLRAFPALSLTNEAGVVTAVGNDVGFDNVFARQVIAFGRPDDVAVAISTSGSSRNVVVALEEARRRGLLCIGLVGYGGGEIVRRGLCEYCFVIDHEYIPRIQEAQASQYHILRRLIG